MNWDRARQRDIVRDRGGERVEATPKAKRPKKAKKKTGGDTWWWVHARGARDCPCCKTTILPGKSCAYHPPTKRVICSKCAVKKKLSVSTSRAYREANGKH